MGLYILKALFSIGIVATLLTIAELAALKYQIFPGIQDTIRTLIKRNGTSLLPGDGTASTDPRTQSIDAVLGALYVRENAVMQLSNSFVMYLAVAFTFVLVMLTWYVATRILSHPGKSWGIDVIWPVGFSLLSVMLIGLFQGFPCLLLGSSSPMCFEQSFARMGTKWKYSNDYARMWWDTGMCDSVKEQVASGTTSQDVDVVAELKNFLSGYRAQEQSQTQSQLQS